MGICGSKPKDLVGSVEENAVNAAIDDKNRDDFRKETQIQKLLLLGAGESGKSTLFKQIVDLYGGGFSEEEVTDYTAAVHTNTLISMETLVRQSRILSGAMPQCAMKPENEQIATAVIAAAEDGGLMTPEIATAVSQLWTDPGIKATFDNRAKFQLPASSADYFFDHVQEYVQANWIPSKQDMLHCRVRTTGIMECKLEYENFHIKVVDVGGQRSERKKWIHSFENVHCVLFVAAISEYDQQLFEDEKMNRVTEALSIFADICNNQYFTESSMILFLNKSDLFREKIAKVPLTTCFKDYNGPANDYDAGWKFIRDKFLDLRQDSNKEIYVHLTCATDDGNVKFVFSSVRDIVVQKALRKTGLMG